MVLLGVCLGQRKHEAAILAKKSASEAVEGRETLKFRGPSLALASRTDAQIGQSRRAIALFSLRREAEGA